MELSSNLRLLVTLMLVRRFLSVPKISTAANTFQKQNMVAHGENGAKEQLKATVDIIATPKLTNVTPAGATIQKQAMEADRGIGEEKYLKASGDKSLSDNTLLLKLLH